MFQLTYNQSISTFLQFNLNKKAICNITNGTRKFIMHKKKFIIEAKVSKNFTIVFKA